MSFWNQLQSVLDVLSIPSTVIVILTLLTSIWLTITGFLPALVRLGKGLSRRRIAIFARADQLSSLKALLADSKLFRSKNLLSISSVGDLGRAEKASVYLVDYSTMAEHLDRIIATKSDQAALIIYAPPSEGRVTEHHMSLLEDCRNVTLSNLRGRLLNDLVVSMITTSYEKK